MNIVRAKQMIFIVLYIAWLWCAGAGEWWGTKELSDVGPNIHLIASPARAADHSAVCVVAVAGSGLRSPHTHRNIKATTADRSWDSPVQLAAWTLSITSLSLWFWTNRVWIKLFETLPGPFEILKHEIECSNIQYIKHLKFTFSSFISLIMHYRNSWERVLFLNLIWIPPVTCVLFYNELSALSTRLNQSLYSYS